MIDRNNPLIREASKLNPLDKLQLVDYLLESLDIPDAEIEKLWARESSRRWEGYKAGETGSVSAAEVFEKYKFRSRVGVRYSEYQQHHRHLPAQTRPESASWT